MVGEGGVDRTLHIGKIMGGHCKMIYRENFRKCNITLTIRHKSVGKSIGSNVFMYTNYLRIACFVCYVRFFQQLVSICNSRVQAACYIVLYCAWARKCNSETYPLGIRMPIKFRNCLIR